MVCKIFEKGFLGFFNSGHFEMSRIMSSFDICSSEPCKNMNYYNIVGDNIKKIKNCTYRLLKSILI